MRNKTNWSLIILVSLVLLLVSCAPAVSEEKEAPVTGEKVSTPVIKEEAKEPDEPKQPEAGTTEEKKAEEPKPDEPQPDEPEPKEPVPEEPKAEEPQPEIPGIEIPPEAEIPPHKYQELAEFALELINRDRAANGLDPVVLAGNAASQNHAEENLANGTSSHWGADGLKPYMRYTSAGGVNYVNENVIGTGIESGGDSSDIRNTKQLIEQAQDRFMESPSHRANILNERHKKVSLGIAFDNDNFHMVQHFEGDYIYFSEPPAMSGTVLSMTGKVTLGEISRIIIYYDPLPQPLSPDELNAPPYDSSYTPGEAAGDILIPPPPGSVYSGLKPTEVVATTWGSNPDGSFSVEADILQILGKGNGVYTVAVLVEISGEFVVISNYSIFF